MATNDLLVKRKLASGRYGEQVITPVAGKMLGFDNSGALVLLDGFNPNSLAPVALSGDAGDLTGIISEDAVPNAVGLRLLGGYVTLRPGVASGIDLGYGELDAGLIYLFNSGGGQLSIDAGGFSDGMGQFFSYDGSGGWYFPRSGLTLDYTGGIGGNWGTMMFTASGEIDAGTIYGVGIAANSYLTVGGSAATFYDTGAGQVANGLVSWLPDGTFYASAGAITLGISGDINCTSISTQSASCYTLQAYNGIGFWGVSPPDSQPARPTDLAGVIAVLAGMGACA